MSPETAREYVASRVLPAMGIPGRRFELAPPPEAGTRSSLHLIRAEGMPPLVLRCFEHHGQAARSAGALRHLDELGLPAPRLVYHDLSRRSRLMPGPAGSLPYVTVETWIEGTRHAGITDPAVARGAALQVAALLARFHAVTRPTWGRPTRPVKGRFVSFFSYTMAGARRMASRLVARGWLSRAEAESILASFSAWSGRVGRITPHHLVHNDANRHNFVLTPDGAVVPVDLHRLAYEPFPEELVNALYHFCRKDAELAAEFEEAYFARAGEESRALFAATRGFFEPLNYLKKCYQRAERATSPPPEAGDAKMSRWRGIVLAMEGPR